MSFALDLSKFADKTSKKAELVVRKIVLECAVSVVKMSPVDTGRFRGNWDYGFNAQPSQTFLTTDRSGAGSVARITGKLGGQMVGNVHYIANNLPYANRLENGWSNQAPNGMVALTVLKFQSIVDNAARAVK